MKKIITLLVIIWIILPFTTNAAEDYLFSNFESSPNAEQIQSITDEKTRFCEQTYLEAMRRRPFSRQEINICKDIFIAKIKAEIEYKRRVMQDRYIY